MAGSEPMGGVVGVQERFACESAGAAVAAIVVRPGDSLIVAMRRRISSEQAATVRDYLKEFVPGVNVVVLDDIAALAVVPEGERQ